MLIPTLAEYEKDNLVNVLWWSSDDYAEFGASACKEVAEVMRKNPHLSKKNIMEVLSNLDSFNSIDDNIDSVAESKEDPVGLCLEAEDPTMKPTLVSLNINIRYSEPQLQCEGKGREGGRIGKPASIMNQNKENVQLDLNGQQSKAQSKPEFNDI